MANQEVTLMKGNEAIAHACIRCGADGFFGYPITPQSEIIETLALLKPWETSGMVVLQAESEVAAINMVYGGAGAGKRVIEVRAGQVLKGILKRFATGRCRVTKTDQIRRQHVEITGQQRH